MPTASIHGWSDAIEMIAKKPRRHVVGLLNVNRESDKNAEI